MALLNRRSDRLAAPTEAMTSRPEPLGLSTSWADESADEADGVRSVLEQAEQLVARHPSSTAALARLAHAALAAGSESRARQAAKRVLADKDATEDPPSLVSAAQVLAVTGDMGLAEEALARLAGRSFPHLYSQFAVERGDFQTALARLDESDDAISESLRGWIFLQCGQFTDAIRTFRQVISRGFVSPDLYINLGYAYGAVGSIRKAIRATQSAVGLAPANRTASFNLAAFRAAAGDEEGALSALRPLSQYYPESLRISFAIADVHSKFQHHDIAERELRRASTSKAAWAAHPIERSELKANIAALQGIQGKRDPLGVRATILGCLESTGYRSLSLARMLAPMFKRVSEADALAVIHRELGRLHNAEDLSPVSARVAFLRLDFAQATNATEAWVASDPFDLQAGAMLTYLLLEVRNDPSAAAQVGRMMLRRYPMDAVLSNNTAYALVLLGECDEAQRLLAASDDNLLALATKALAEVRLGNIDEGLQLYETAALAAAKMPEYSDATQLIRYRAAQVARIFGRRPSHNESDLALELADDPRFHVLQASEVLTKFLR